MPHEEEQEARVLGALIGELSGESRLLLHQFIALAKTEMADKFSVIARDLGMMAAGGALAYAGLLAVVASLVLLLARVMPWWAAALVVGVVAALAGGLAVRAGLKEVRRKGIMPRETLEALREETEWLGRLTREMRQEAPETREMR